MPIVTTHIYVMAGPAIPPQDGRRIFIDPYPPPPAPTIPEFPLVPHPAPKQTFFYLVPSRIVVVPHKMADKESSSAKSYVDQAIAAGQSALGSLTGNPADKVVTLFNLSSSIWLVHFPNPVSHFSHTTSYITHSTISNRSPLNADSFFSQSQAETTKAHAKAEKDASHTVGKLGPIAASPSGGISTDDPRRAEGNMVFPFNTNLHPLFLKESSRS